MPYTTGIGLKMLWKMIIPSKHEGWNSTFDFLWIIDLLEDVKIQRRRWKWKWFQTVWKIAVVIRKRKACVLLNLILIVQQCPFRNHTKNSQTKTNNKNIKRDPQKYQHQWFIIHEMLTIPSPSRIRLLFKKSCSYFTNILSKKLLSCTCPVSPWFPY